MIRGSRDHDQVECQAALPASPALPGLPGLPTLPAKHVSGGPIMIHQS